MAQIIRISPTNVGLLDHCADVFDEDVVPERLRACAADDTQFLIVAVEDEQVIGQCLGHVHRHPDKPTELYIDDLAVDEAFRRRGIAQAMVLRLVGLGREAGCEEIWVATEDDNTVARAFYASLGLVSRPALVFEDVLAHVKS